MVLRILFVFLLIGLPGCSVGPDYEKPSTPLPRTWVSGETNAPPAPEAAPDETWWMVFNDPVLTQLITKSVAGNMDLKIAEDRITEARASRSVARATLLPSGDMKGSFEREANQFALPGSFPGLTKPFDVFQTGFDASWELDVFGGHRREIEGANASLEAADASRADAWVSLSAEVARTYIDIRQYQQQLKIAEDTIKSDKSTAAIAKQRFDVGDTARIDLTQAEAQLERAEAQLPYYRNSLAQAEFSMDVLLGEQPGATKPLVETMMPIPVSDQKLVLAAPSSVIANRPDIRVAERKLAAATAQQGVAVAKFFPDLSLTGFIGLLNTNAGNLLNAASESWTMGGSVLWPILSYGTLSANLDSANAHQQEAMTAYQKTIIEALSDVEKSVTAYTQEDEYRLALDRSMKKDQHAADIARQRYKEGLTSFLEVLDAERTLYDAQNTLTDADAKTSQNLVAVYKSLGGGWHIPPAPASLASPH